MSKAFKFNLGLAITAVYLTPNFIIRFGEEFQGVYVEAGIWRISVRGFSDERQGLLFGKLDSQSNSHMYTKSVEEISIEYFTGAKIISILVKENPLDVEILIESPKLENGYLLVEIYSISGFEVGGLEIEPGYRNWLTSNMIGYDLIKGLPTHEVVDL